MLPRRAWRVGDIGALGAAQHLPHGLLDRAFAGFWAAETSEDVDRAIDTILEAGADVETLTEALRAGRPYDDAVERGIRTERHQTSDGLTLNASVLIPEGYDPSRRYPVHVQLHGGIGTTFRNRGARIDRRRIEDGFIYVFPSGWANAQWWHANQVEHLALVLRSLKREYNVDENQVYLSGISDGGTGAYFMAARHTTPWAGFLPFIGHIGVLANPRVGADGDIFIGNLKNKPFFVVNGGRDRLYPTSAVEPSLELMAREGVTIVYRPQPTGEHNLNWWPDEREEILRFMREHPRDPLPDRLSWETERVDRYNRAHWLVIDELDGNDHESGRVDLRRKDNVVEVATDGVSRYTLLLSPDRFDFGRPIVIVTNGRTSFEGRVDPDARTLLEWAARDRDRTMLFAAELHVEVEE